MEEGIGQVVGMFLKVILFSMVTAGCALAQKGTSFYSTTNAKFVAVISSSALENEPEIDHFEHLCPGYGGYELLHRSGDLRSWIDVRYQGVTSDLFGATMTTAAGSFPYKANDVVEWRGILKESVFTPYALIYRIQAQDPEDEGKEVSRLVVVALNKGKAKVLGSTSGKSADTEAKKLADTVAPGK
ncbi:hypothetical protein V2O64_12945 [Verrucomicrobiaceae bacterium 227]